MNKSNPNYFNIENDINKINKEKLEKISKNLPKEASDLFNIIIQNEKIDSILKNIDDLKVNTSSTSPGLDSDKLTGINESLLQNYIPEKKPFIIDENFNFLDIKIGKDERSNVEGKMHIYGKSLFTNSRNSLFFKELGITFYFDSKNILKEIYFDKDFSGEMISEIRIGSTIEQAIQKHGNPNIMLIKSSIWNKFTLFINNGLIEGIRLH